LKDAASKAEQLEKENHNLRQEIEDLRQKQCHPVSIATMAVAPGNSGDVSLANASQQPPPIPRRVLGEIPSNKAAGNGRPDLEKDYTNLAKRYASLEARFEAKQLAGRKVRDDRNAWMKYAENLEAKLNKGKRRQIQGSATTPASSTAVRPAAPNATETKAPALNSSFISNPEANPRQVEHDDAIQRSRHARRAASTPATATQQNEQAQDEAHCQETADDTNDAELPKLPPPPATGFQMAIKQEPPSDDVVVISERGLRKRKVQDDQDETEPPARRMKSEHGVSSDPVVTREVTTFLPQESMDFDAGPTAFPTPRRQRFQGAEAYLNRDSDNEEGEAEDTSSRVPLDGAARGNKPSGTACAREELLHGIADVVEEITGLPPRKAAEVANSAQRKQERPQSHTNNVAIEPEPGVPRLTNQARDYNRDPFELDLVALRVLRERQEKQGKPPKAPIEAPFPKPKDSIPISRPPKNKNPAKDGTLRQRQMADLRMEDFKINPKFNNGHTHAYEEVVRDKASRAELPGCIDPNCCGKQFRAMAQSELESGGIAILSREDDIKLLESYLGDEAYRLIGMKIEDRRKLWLEAKTRDLANKYGRHRARFVRRPSPPGYWNPDFPSTQEVADNREEGRRIERRMIEDRWKEAMRGGGMWLFRDE